MKIAIFHPQISVYGGGEIISLTIASILSKDNKVDIYAPYKANLKEIENFFGVKLANVGIKNLGILCNLLTKIPTLNTYKLSFYTKRMLRIKGYDLIFDTGSNGMFYKEIKCKTVCYINYKQFPRLKTGWKKLTNFLLINPKKAFKYDVIISNSEFTRKEIKKYSDNKESLIVNPPVFIDDIPVNNKKKNYILTIGRLTNDKKIEVMIEAFRKLYSKLGSNWKFHIIGVFKEGNNLYDNSYYDMLKSKAKGFPIIFHENMEHKSLLNFISNCKIYWHARGYGETHPDEMENFGISTVEAMAAGCVPVVINKGGQPEIVDHKKNGFLWDKPEEMIKYTQDLIKNEKLMKKLSISAIKKSRKYDYRIFEKRIKEAIRSLF